MMGSEKEEGGRGGRKNRFALTDTSAANLPSARTTRQSYFIYDIIEIY